MNDSMEEDNSSEEITLTNDDCTVCCKSQIICQCINNEKFQEKIVKNDPKSIDFLISSGLSQYFDFDQGFYIPETHEYDYNPNNLLENQLKNYKIGPRFLQKFEKMLKFMHHLNIYFKTFPNTLIIATVTENEISGFVLALLFESEKKLKDLFYYDKNDYYIEDMKMNLMKLCIACSNNYQLQIEDFIPIEKFENPELDQGIISGKGGFASVYKNRLLNKTVAIKIPHLTKEDLHSSKRTIEREYSIMKILNDKYIARPFGIVQYNSRLCIVMEYYNGISLKSSLKKLNLGQLNEIMKGVAIGMHKIHKAGFVHQDLKPSNILIRDKSPKIIDLGLAARPSELNEVNGFTVKFADPLQIHNMSPGYPADVWTFALTFIFSLLEIHQPMCKVEFPKNSEQVLVKARPYLQSLFYILSPTMYSIIKSCLNTNPLDRPGFLDIIRAF